MNSQVAAFHPATAPDMSVTPLEALEPGNYFPLWLGSDTLRQNALDGLVASWGMRRPFYLRQNGIFSLMCGRERDVREVYMDPERFTVEPPKRPGYELFDMFGGLESVLQMDGARHNRVRRLMNPSFNQASMELRPNRQTLVFGTGIHHCIGQRLARFVLRSAIGGLIERFPGVRLADPAFRPVYQGLTGELAPVSVPMRTH